MKPRMIARYVSWMRQFNHKAEALIGPKGVSLIGSYRSFLRAVSCPGAPALHLGAGRDRLAYRDELGGQTLVSTDINIESLESNPNHLRVVCDAQALPFRVGSFSLVFSEYVFEHLRDPWKVLEQVDRVLRPGEHFVVLVPNPRHYFSWVARITPYWVHKILVNLPCRDETHFEAHDTYYRWGAWGDFPKTALRLGWELKDLRSEPGPTVYTQVFPFHILFVLVDRVLSLWQSMHVGYAAVFRKPDERVTRMRRVSAISRAPSCLHEKSAIQPSFMTINGGRHQLKRVMSYLPTARLPLNLLVIAKDLLAARGGDLPSVNGTAKVTNADAIRLLARWLERAYKVVKGGLSNGYHLLRGWQPPHVETSGYAIVTLFDLARFLGDRGWVDRAIQVADWELSRQAADGSYPTFSLSLGRKVYAFDTAQVLQGLVRAYQETRYQEFLAASVLAGKWLVRTQDENGAWPNCFHDMPHTYHTRIAWPLVQLYQETGFQAFRDAAKRNLDWALGQMDESDWLNLSGFTAGSSSYTHTIAYAMEGFLECGAILGDDRYLEAAWKIGAQLYRTWNAYQMMPGEFSKGWQPDTSYTCPAGNAQIALCWWRLFELTGDRAFRESAQVLNGCSKATLISTSLNKEIIGGVKGSHPVYGKYLPFFLPLWAAKFLVDTLLAEERI